jgi:phosphoenolpyruvate synthase/pyruvate phosphate dikinase
MIYKIKRDQPYPLALIGNKGFNLQAEARRFRIPSTWFINTETVQFIHSGQQPLEWLRPYIQDILKQTKDRFAIRSSGVKSLPGVLQSVVPVERDEDAILTAIEQVIRSWDSPQAVEMRRMVRMGDDINMAVLIQVVIEPEFSGVTHSIDPATGMGVVTGEYVEGFLDQYCLGNAVGKNVLSLPGDILQKVVETVSQASWVDDYPAEVEWAYRNGLVYLIQRRDATLTDTAFFKWYDRQTSPSAKAQKYLHLFDRRKCITFETDAQPLVKGDYISGPVFIGNVTYSPENVGPETLFVGGVSTETQLAVVINSGDLLITNGGRYSHTADQARKLGKAAAYYAEPLPHHLPEGTLVTLAAGRLYLGVVSGRETFMYDGK